MAAQYVKDKREQQQQQRTNEMLEQQQQQRQRHNSTVEAKKAYIDHSNNPTTPTNTSAGNSYNYASLPLLTITSASGFGGGAIASAATLAVHAQTAASGYSVAASPALTTPTAAHNNNFTFVTASLTTPTAAHNNSFTFVAPTAHTDYASVVEPNRVPVQMQSVTTAAADGALVSVTRTGLPTSPGPGNDGDGTVTSPTVEKNNNYKTVTGADDSAAGYDLMTSTSSDRCQSVPLGNAYPANQPITCKSSQDFLQSSELSLSPPVMTSSSTSKAQTEFLPNDESSLHSNSDAAALDEFARVSFSFDFECARLPLSFS